MQLEYPLGVMFKSAILITALAAIAVGGTVTTAVAQDNTEATVQVRVWQSLEDAERLYVSARPASGSWATLGTIRLPLDDGQSSDGRFIYGDIRLDVPVADRPPVTVEVRVWQHSLRLERVYVSARPAFGSWATLGTIRLLLDDGETSSYRYGDIRLGVPLPPPLPSVTVEFYGSFSADQRTRYEAEIRRWFEDVATFYANRYGLVSEDLTIRLTTRDAPEDIGFAYGGGTLYLRQHRIEPTVVDQEGGSVTTVAEELAFLAPLAHEYVHALQETTGVLDGPLWIQEGMAWYLDALHEQAQDVPPVVVGEVDDPAVFDAQARHFFKSREYLWWQARKSTVPLRDMESGQWHWGVGYLAIEQLVARAGEDALFDFYRLLPAASSWQEAFSDAFGLTADAFYEEFAAWRAVEVPPPSYWSGVILGPDGDPVQDVPLRWAPSVAAGVEGFQGVTVRARRSVVGDMDTWTTAPVTRAGWAREESGTFRMPADPGLTVLTLAIECDEGQPLEVGFVDEAGELTRDPDEARRYVIGLEGVSGIEIRLPRTPEELCALLQEKRGREWIANRAIGWPIGFHDRAPHYAWQYESRPWNGD